MKVTILGNNGPFPSAGGACSSYLIECEGVRVLADAGSGSLSNLMKIMNPSELDAVILSHLHWDHMTDIPVLFYNLHVRRLGGEQFQNIPLYLPQTPMAMFETIAGFSAFDINVLNGDSRINIRDLEITAAPMTHPVESYATKYSKNGKSIVYSGDTTHNTLLPVFASGSDLLITDSGFLERQMTESSPHMSALQCARIASDAGVGKLILSHLNPNTSREQYIKEARTVFAKTDAAVLMETIEV